MNAINVCLVLAFFGKLNKGNSLHSPEKTLYWSRIKQLIVICDSERAAVSEGPDIAVCAQSWQTCDQHNITQNDTPPSRPVLGENKGIWTLAPDSKTQRNYA